MSKVVRLHVPNPSPCKPIVDYVDSPLVRRLRCRTYNNCLNVAYKLDWESFTCNGCKAFVSFSRDDLRADAEAIADMLNSTPILRKLKG